MREMGETGREVRLSVVGLGARGLPQLKLLLSMPDVSVVAVCDIYEDRALAGRDAVVKTGRQAPLVTTDYHEAIACKDAEAVVIMTSWQTHIRIACEAMRAGKIVAMEVGGASSVDECWKLVRTSEETHMPCMLLENCCYGREEMALLSMIGQGVFGELVHCRGAYAHDLRDEVGLGDKNRHYRQDNFRLRSGELYPTHELGPIFKYLRMQRGNRMLTLCAMASKAVGQRDWMQANRPDLAGMRFRQGDVVTTMISCAGGETILLTHDCTLARPYSRGGVVQGTRGIWQEDGRLMYVEGRTKKIEGDWTHRFESDEPYMREYQHPLWREYDAFGQRGGHDGMDYLVLRAFIESIQEQKPFPIDVYDTAALMVVTALSEQSIALGSAPVPVPDFTDGLWMDKREKHAGRYQLDA